MLQKAGGKADIVQVTAGQLMKLLHRDIVFYLAERDRLGEPDVFMDSAGAPDPAYISENEKAVAAWVLKNNKRAGATTATLGDAKCYYLAVRVAGTVYGVAGIVVGETPLDAFENNIVLSILGECALALESEQMAVEKEEAAVLAKNEQLRANLLRAISHDLRTPLTSISGNASNLLANEESFDKATRHQIYRDIYNDSLWLINLVENLLSVTRITKGEIQLHLTAELMDEVVAEALRHVGRQSAEHTIRVISSDDLILAKIDAKLMVQVVINIVDNAIKYTPPVLPSPFPQKKDKIKSLSKLRTTVRVFPMRLSHGFLICFTPEQAKSLTAGAAWDWGWRCASPSLTPTAAPFRFRTTSPTELFSPLLYRPRRLICMNKPTILAVEDDAAIRSLISTTLKTHDYNYLTARDGRSALLEASSHNPDIILLDLGLPDMDGVDIIQAIRQWSGVPIIVISARSEDTDKIKALDAGADDYLTKPFFRGRAAGPSAGHSEAAGRAAGAAHETSVFVNGQLKIDYAAGCVYLNDQELHLTPIEYKLLLPACQTCRQGADPFLYHRFHLGKPCGQRRGVSAGVHGNTAQKDRTRSQLAPIYPDPYRRGIPNAPGGIKREHH